MNWNTQGLDWDAENKKDAHMLALLDLSPMDATCVEGDDELVQLVERHNATLAGLKERFGRLATDRQPACDADKWRASDSTAVIAARRRVLAESWDVVLAVRNALDDREALLRRIEANVQARLPGLIERREKAYAKAHKALEREYRDYLKAEPHRGAAHVASLAEDDETVAPLQQEIGQAGEHHPLASGGPLQGRAQPAGDDPPAGDLPAPELRPGTCPGSAVALTAGSGQCEGAQNDHAERG